MSIKKINSPQTGAIDYTKQIGESNEIENSKIEKTFAATLAEFSGQIDKTESSNRTVSNTQNILRNIASDLNFDIPEEVMKAVRNSAQIIVGSRFEEKFRSSAEGKKITADLSEFISNDPFLYRKILELLQKLK